MREIKLTLCAVLAIFAIAIGLYLYQGGYFPMIVNGLKTIGIIIVVLVAIIGGWLLIHRRGIMKDSRELTRLQLKSEIERQERERNLADAEAEHKRALAYSIRTAAERDLLAAQATAQTLLLRGNLFYQERQQALANDLYHPTEQGHYPFHLGRDSQGQVRVTPADRSHYLPASRDQVTAPAAPAVIGGSQMLRLPPAFRDIDILRGSNLDPEEIYLGTGPGRQVFNCSLPGWHHIAHDASTGGGKTLLMRFEISVQLAMGMDVILCNPHFTPVEEDDKHPDGFIDWRPVAAKLESQGRVDYTAGATCSRLLIRTKSIVQLLGTIANIELDRRFSIRQQLRPGQAKPWKPLYIAVDELLWIISQHPEVTEYLTAILQRGRAVDVRLSTNAQGFLVSQLKMPGSVRENFGTAYWLGGSDESGARMVDMGVKDLRQLLKTHELAGVGKGVGILRNEEAVKKASPVRIPLGTNEGTYYLLGEANDYILPEFRQGNTNSYRRNEGDSENEAPFKRVPQTSIVEADTARPSNLRNFPTMAGNPVPERPEASTEKLRLTEVEQGQLIAAYKVGGSINKALKAISHGARYFDHARETLEQAGLIQAKAEGEGA